MYGFQDGKFLALVERWPLVEFNCTHDEDLVLLLLQAVVCYNNYWCFEIGHKGHCFTLETMKKGYIEQ